DDGLQPALRLLGAGGLPPADVTLIELEPDGDVQRMVVDGDVDAAVVGDDPAALRVLGSQSVRWELDVLLTAAAGQVQVERAAAAQGLTAGQVRDLTTATPPAVVLLDARPQGPVPPQVLVVVFGSLFFLSVLVFGMSIAQSVVEEKQSRVVELLVAAVPVRVLLAGKVLGSTAMAVGQVVLVVAVGLGGAWLAGHGAVVGDLVRASVWFVVFFLLGFAMLACLWAAAGSLASRVEDLNATTIPMQVLVVATFLAAVFTTEPGGVQRVLSYVPLTAPLMMPTRIVLGNAAPWEPVVAAAVVAATAAVLVAVGARLYSRSVLHTAGRLRATQAWRSDER
ncbi:ABC transporter permease, partial [Cellulomonas bogoriensis 69B4 = DSM 16987]